MKLKGLSAELKRRNVYKVAIAYAAVAWMFFEAVSVLVHVNQGPSGIIHTLAFLILIGFALTLYVSWAFELTPQGLKRTARITAEEIGTLPYWSARKFKLFITTTSLIAAGLLAFDLLRH